MIWLLLYAVFVSICLGGYLAYVLYVMHNARLKRVALKAYDSARGRLLLWKVARPFLKIAHCAYSRSLVFEMIEAYTQLLKLEAVHNKEHLQELYALLTQNPSPYDPTHFDSTSVESFFIKLTLLGLYIS